MNSAIIKKNRMRLVGMPLSRETAYNAQVLNSIPSTKKKEKPSVVVHTCDTSALDARAEGWK